MTPLINGSSNLDGFESYKVFIHIRTNVWIEIVQGVLEISCFDIQLNCVWMYSIMLKSRAKHLSQIYLRLNDVQNVCQIQMLYDFYSVSSDQTRLPTLYQNDSDQIWPATIGIIVCCHLYGWHYRQVSKYLSVIINKT